MVFIGQKKVLDSLRCIDSRSVLLAGPKHWGKKTLLRQFFLEAGDNVYEVSGNAQEFRESMDFIRTQALPMIYLIPDVDKLNVTVQNMLLKVLEEPPMKARFFLTASNSILPTLTSRCVTIRTEPYSVSEIHQYLQGRTVYAEYGDSPGRCQCLMDVFEFSNDELPDSVRNQMLFLKKNLRGNLALILWKANDLTKLFRDVGADYFTFYLLARKIYEGYDSLSIISRNLESLDRYVLMDFYMSLWKEEQCR